MMKRVKGAVNNLLSFTILLTSTTWPLSKTIKAIPNGVNDRQAQNISD